MVCDTISYEDVRYRFFDYWLIIFLRYTPARRPLSIYPYAPQGILCFCFLFQPEYRNVLDLFSFITYDKYFLFDFETM